MRCVIQLAVEDLVMENQDIPVPPGAEDDHGTPIVAQAEVLDAPVVEEAKDEPKGFFQKAWALLKSAAGAVGGAVGTAAGWCVGCIYTAYSYTLGPVLDWVETWVPGAGSIREAAFWYGVGLVIVGAIFGGLIFAEAGYLFPVVLLGMILGAVLLPVLVITTPAVWLMVAADLYMLSCIFICIDVTCDYIAGHVDEEDGFFRTLLFRMAPGIYDAVAGWSQERADQRALEAAEKPAVAGAPA